MVQGLPDSNDRVPATHAFAARLQGLRRRWPALALALAFILMTGHVVHWRLYGKSPGEGDDHLVRREYGRRLLWNEPLHSDWKCFNYMPTAALCWAPLALCGPGNSKLLCYFAAVAGLALSLHWLARMLGPSCRTKPFTSLANAALAVTLTAHYLGRDLRDGGHQTILLTLLVGGIYLAWRGRDLGAAVCFGLSIAVKITPALLLPFLVWKRKWRLAVFTTAATLLWIVAPAAWMGVGPWWRAQQTWNEVALNSLLLRPDQRLEANNTRVNNQALRPAVMRLLVAYPPGHLLRVDHPADVPILDLSPQTANWVVQAVLGGLILLCVWRSRRPYRSADDPAWPLEASGVLILSLLLSPLVWTQHIGLILPAVYLLVAHHRSVGRLPRVAVVLLGIYAIFSLLLMRDVVGMSNYLLLLSFHMHTACMLIILGLLLWLRPVAAEAEKRLLSLETAAAPGELAARAA